MPKDSAPPPFERVFHSQAEINQLDRFIKAWQQTFRYAWENEKPSTEAAAFYAHLLTWIHNTGLNECPRFGSDRVRIIQFEPDHVEQLDRLEDRFILLVAHCPKHESSGSERQFLLLDEDGRERCPSVASTFAVLKDAHLSSKHVFAADVRLQAPPDDCPDHCPSDAVLRARACSAACRFDASCTQPDAVGAAKVTSMIAHGR